MLPYGHRRSCGRDRVSRRTARLLGDGGGRVARPVLRLETVELGLSVGRGEQVRGLQAASGMTGYRTPVRRYQAGVDRADGSVVVVLLSVVTRRDQSPPPGTKLACLLPCVKATPPTCCV